MSMTLPGYLLVTFNRCLMGFAAFTLCLMVLGITQMHPAPVSFTEVKIPTLLPNQKQPLQVVTPDYYQAPTKANIRIGDITATVDQTTYHLSGGHP